MNIYTIYDSKAQTYIQPFYAVNNGVAIRLFQTAAMDEKHDFHRHGADYTLFHIAIWEEKTGTIAQNETHENLGNGITVQKLTPIQGE